MLTSGAMIDGPGPTYATATAVRTAAEVRRAVDLRAVAGADHVKIYTKFTADLLRPLLDEATTLRLPVAAHLGKIDALTAARAGVASLEHMAGVVAAASRDPTPYFRAHDQFLRGWTTEERSEEHTSELQSRLHLVCRLLLEKKKKTQTTQRVQSE